jgi:hypothetical protein
MIAALHYSRTPRGGEVSIAVNTVTRTDLEVRAAFDPIEGRTQSVEQSLDPRLVLEAQVNTTTTSADPKGTIHTRCGLEEKVQPWGARDSNIILEAENGDFHGGRAEPEQGGYFYGAFAQENSSATPDDNLILHGYLLPISYTF